MSISAFLFILLFCSIPAFLFLYNLIAAIYRNVHQAIHSEKAGEVTAIGNIFLASLGLVLIMAMFALVLLST